MKIILNDTFAWNKQAANYFSSKDGFILDQQRIAIQSLQWWRAVCKSPHSKGNSILYRGKKSWEGYHKPRILAFSVTQYWPGRKRSLYSSCWALLSWQGMRVLSSDHPTTLFRCHVLLPLSYSFSLQQRLFCSRHLTRMTMLWVRNKASRSTKCLLWEAASGGF